MSHIRKRGNRYWLTTDDNVMIEAIKISPFKYTTGEIFAEGYDDGGDTEPGAPSPNPGNGKLIMPFPENTISSPYGWRTHPIWGDGRFHEGIDFARAGGTPVPCAGDGVVTGYTWWGGWGNALSVDHGNGISTQYNHLQSAMVAVGAQVVQGQHIARVGTTGDSTGNHLDFNVLVAGYTNPIGSPRADPNDYCEFV